jgi:endonuclease/exonuclease/phosphatase family metal-dependent hydrolase
MRIAGKIAWNIVRTVAFIAIVLLVAAAFSDRISPLKCVYFSYLGLFFPFIVLLNLLLLIVAAIWKKWKMCTVFIIGFLISSGAIRNYFPIHFGGKKDVDGSIKILTYNVMGFEWLTKNKTGTMNPILDFIARTDADIVCIQEYSANTNNPKKLQKTDILNALKAWPFHHIEVLHANKPYSEYGMAVFSKFPILKTERIKYDSFSHNGAIVSEIDIMGQKMTLINCHLESNKLSPEDKTGFFEATTNPSSEKLENFTHLMFRRLTPAFRSRASQAQAIARVIEANSNPYLVVCGDFNDTPISYARHAIRGSLSDAFVETGLGPGITFNRYRFLFRIDNILYNNNIEAIDCHVGSLRNSDHYPVVSRLQLLNTNENKDKK